MRDPESHRWNCARLGHDPTKPWLLAGTIRDMGEDRDTSSELLTLFTPHTEGETLDDVYYRTMRTATDIIFKLGHP